jgi:hypothetical protein
MICFMWSQLWRTTQLLISDYGECIVLWPNKMNANNHIASARPSLFRVQLIKFSLYRTRRIVKFLSLGRLPKESIKVRGPLKRFVTMHQESIIYWSSASTRSVRHPVERSVMCYWASSAQSFSALRPVGTRDHIFILSRPFTCFQGLGVASVLIQPSGIFWKQSCSHFR